MTPLRDLHKLGTSSFGSIPSPTTLFLDTFSDTPKKGTTQQYNVLPIGNYIFI